MSAHGAGFGTEKRAVGNNGKSTSDMPGPGMYSLDHGNDAVAVGFGTSRRSGMDQSAKNVPGPG